MTDLVPVEQINFMSSPIRSDLIKINYHYSEFWPMHYFHIKLNDKPRIFSRRKIDK